MTKLWAFFEIAYLGIQTPLLGGNKQISKVIFIFIFGSSYIEVVSPVIQIIKNCWPYGWTKLSINMWQALPTKSFLHDCKSNFFLIQTILHSKINFHQSFHNFGGAKYLYAMWYRMEKGALTFNSQDLDLVSYFDGLRFHKSKPSPGCLLQFQGLSFPIMWQIL